MESEWFVGNLSILKKPLIGMHAVNIGSYISNSAGMPFAYQIRPETVGQFTGLKDKNGNNIYEGDILSLGKTSSFVVWSLDGWRFNSYMERGTLDLYEYVDTTTGNEIAEIIGNIHQNKELLES